MYDAKHYEASKHAAFTNHALSTVALLVSEQRWKSTTNTSTSRMQVCTSTLKKHI